MSDGWIARFALCALLVLSPAWPLNGQQAAVPGPEARWSLAAAGDAIITRRIAQFDHAGDPAFAAMTRVIREADAATLNLEISLFRLETFDGWPEVENGGNWELGPPEAARDLQEMGFDMFSRANNHTTDYGVAGMRVTNRLLEDLGIVHAGTGENPGWASRPGYLDTPKGRIALISLATTFTNMSRAGAVRPETPGRPGLNALRTATRYEGTPETLARAGEVAVDAGAETYIIHGPHQVRGIEIYKGRPIFYSLGNFVFQNETIDPMPSDNYESFDLPPTALAKDL